MERIVLVAHTHGPTPMEDDRVPTRRLAELLKGESICVIEDDLSPGELAALYGSARLVIGTRFHSVIFALAGGTPVYAISYFGPKAWGIMDMMGMKEHCVDMEHFSELAVIDRIRKMDYEEEKKKIHSAVGAFRRQIEDAIYSIRI